VLCPELLSVCICIYALSACTGPYDHLSLLFAAFCDLRCIMNDILYNVGHFAVYLQQLSLLYAVVDVVDELTSLS